MIAKLRSLPSHVDAPYGPPQSASFVLCERDVRSILLWHLPHNRPAPWYLMRLYMLLALPRSSLCLYCAQPHGLGTYKLHEISGVEKA